MTFGFFEFMIAALAVYRISLLFSKEYGPAGIFDKLRKVPPKKSDTYKWLSCIFCFSMTASAFVCFCLWLIGHRFHYAQWFLIWTALSSVAIIINQRFTKGDL
jgi:hypothetical protein